MRKLVHEAFQVNRILIVIHSAPEMRRDVRVAHRVVDEQVRNRIAERALRTARIKALEHNWVFAVLQVLRSHIGKNRLARNPHVQRREILVAVKSADHLRLGNGVVAAVRHVLFARPDELHRRARHLLGNRDHLLHVVVRRAPAKAAARRHLVNIALRERQA